MIYQIKHDNFRTNRGNYSRILEIRCRKCDALICYYQKDGPGNLRRMYLDRMINSRAEEGKMLTCPNCDFLLGMKITYEKENRPAYRLFVDAVSKRIVNKKEVQ